MSGLVRKPVCLPRILSISTVVKMETPHQIFRSRASSSMEPLFPMANFTAKLSGPSVKDGSAIVPTSSPPGKHCRDQAMDPFPTDSDVPGLRKKWPGRPAHRGTFCANGVFSPTLSPPSMYLDLPGNSLTICPPVSWALLNQALHSILGFPRRDLTRAYDLPDKSPGTNSPHLLKSLSFLSCHVMTISWTGAYRRVSST